jgi:hypothetical protein
MFWVPDEDNPPFGRIQVDSVLCIGARNAPARVPMARSGWMSLGRDRDAGYRGSGKSSRPNALLEDGRGSEFMADALSDSNGLL